jgi:hypothetical protein
MDYILVALLGMTGGAFCVFMVLEAQRQRLRQQKRQQDASLQEIQSDIHALAQREEQFERDLARRRAGQEEEMQSALRALKAREEKSDRESSQLKQDRAEFESRAIQYGELQQENTILKRDLRNIDVHLRKLKLDYEMQGQAQGMLDERIRELGGRYLKENVKWIGASLNPNNFANCKQRLQDVIERCRGIKLDVPTDEEAALYNNLKDEYQMIVRAAFEREEQTRIKAQIREEQLREREIERELKQLEREREAIKVALEKALADAQNQHSEEVERLQARLVEAEERAQRAISQAQLTKSGHVYVISNIGSFGDGVFKVGMTRRLEPGQRILELGSASVPFPFDVHMMISSNDAPALENALHRKLFRLRVNKTNPRKEFFKTDITAIYQIVKEHHGEVQYVADAEALQYRQSLTMTDEDQEFVESVYNRLEEDEEVVADEA